MTDLFAAYSMMLRIRLFEERISELRAAGEVVGSVHLCNGQEAISTGAVAALDLTRDAVFPTYRGHGWSLACGVPLTDLFAELLGREGGINGGRGGSAYHFAPRYGMYGENSIVGAGTVIAAGAALAAQYDGSGRVAVTVIGDGAMNQGAVHEALNFAAVRRLPMIFIVENNRYSELTPIASMARVDRLYRRGSPYGIESCRIDGNDVGTVENVVAEGRRRAMRGDGPVLIEATTERLVGHYIGDAQHYRPAGELEAIRELDPIKLLRQRLSRQGSEHAVQAIDDQIHTEIESSAARALGMPVADREKVFEHLYG